MRVTYEDDQGRGKIIEGPADLTTVAGGTVTITGAVPDRARTAWSMHLGNYVTRGGQVLWASGRR